MNASSFWPLVWKEYRAGRAFWLAMVGMGLAAQGSVAWLAHQPADRNWWLYGIALMISAGFAVGTGGTLFAIEHEERTFALLRVLPVQAKELGSAKLICALTGLLSLLAALWLAAGALAGWQALAPDDARRLWGLWGLASAEGLAWGIFCSLAIRSPLRATMAAVMALTLTIQFAVTLTKTHNLADIVSYVEAIPLRLALLALVVAADIWLLPRWLSEQFPRAQRSSAGGGFAVLRRVAGRAWPSNESCRVLGHLVWQSWREGWKYFLSLVIVIPLSLIFLAEIFTAAQWVTSGGLAALLPQEAIGAIPFVLFGAMIGGLVFHADQLHGPRFLAERGVSARAVWLSRQIAWGGWLPVWAILLIVLPLVQRCEPWIMSGEPTVPLYDDAPGRSRLVETSTNEWARNAWLLFEMTFSAYAAGQLVSLNVRRGLLAALFSVALGILAAGWAWWMFFLGIPLWWSVLPLPLAMLLATWLRVPAWLLERADWRCWMTPLAAVLVPAAMLAIGVPCFRFNEIPASDGWDHGVVLLSVPSSAGVAAAQSKFAGYQQWMDRHISMIAPSWPAIAVTELQSDVDYYHRALDFYVTTAAPGAAEEAQVTFRLCQQASDLCREGPKQFNRWNDQPPMLDPDDEVWVKPIVDLVLEASGRPYNLAALPLMQRRQIAQMWDFAPLLKEAARLHQDHGDLDAALDIYVGLLRLDTQRAFYHNNASWMGGSFACAPDILSTLAKWAAAPGQTPERIQAAIDRLKNWHDTLPPAYTLLLTDYQTTALSIADLPKAVGENLLPLWMFNQAEWLASRLPWERDRALRLLNSIAASQLQEAAHMEVAFERDTQAPLARSFVPQRYNQYALTIAAADGGQWLDNTPLVKNSELAHQSLAWFVLCRETNYRATSIMLALEAWQLEHGSLPDTLDELVGSGLETVPHDPLYAQPFLYYPHGIAAVPPPANADWRTTPLDFGRSMAAGPSVSLHWNCPAFMAGQPFLWSALNQDAYLQLVYLQRGDFGAGELGYCRFYPGRNDRDRPVSHAAIDVLEAGDTFFIPQREEKQP